MVAVLRMGGKKLRFRVVVISLIPYTYHATVIKSAIRKKKNVVTFV